MNEGYRRTLSLRLMARRAGKTAPRQPIGNMEAMTRPLFPPAWRVVEMAVCFVVRDAAGVAGCFIVQDRAELRLIPFPGCSQVYQRQKGSSQWAGPVFATAGPLVAVPLGRRMLSHRASNQRTEQERHAPRRGVGIRRSWASAMARGLVTPPATTRGRDSPPAPHARLRRGGGDPV
jgi:hypothetical protein